MKVLMIILAGLAFVSVCAVAAGVPVFWLWNWLCPSIFGLPVITIWQAMGLNILCLLLFRWQVTSSSK